MTPTNTIYALEQSAAHGSDHDYMNLLRTLLPTWMQQVQDSITNLQVNPLTTDQSTKLNNLIQRRYSKMDYSHSQARTDIADLAQALTALVMRPDTVTVDSGQTEAESPTTTVEPLAVAEPTGPTIQTSQPLGIQIANNFRVALSLECAHRRILTIARSHMMRCQDCGSVSDLTEVAWSLPGVTTALVVATVTALLSTLARPDLKQSVA